MNKVVSLLLSCLVLGYLFGARPSAAKEEAFLDGLGVMNSDTELLLYFRVENGFTPEMEQGVQNGIPVTFTFFVNLFEIGNDTEREMVSHSFDHTLTYDTIKQVYTVEMEEIGGRRVTARSLEEAREVMTDIHDFPLAGLNMLENGSRYQVKVKARLAKKTLPLNFHYIIPFWQLWKFETDWYSLRFGYGNSGPATSR